ncbi:Interferon-activable protein 202 [Lemmus lemmus]
MSQLNKASPSSTHSADDQLQTAPSHSLDLAESRPTPAADLAIIKGNNCIRYAIMDQTGEIKVVVSGRLTSVNCRIGDRIELVGLELTTNVDECFLRAGRYSYMEVCTLGQQCSS